MLPRLTFLYDKTNKKKKAPFVDTVYEVALWPEKLKPDTTRKTTVTQKSKSCIEIAKYTFQKLETKKNTCIIMIMSVYSFPGSSLARAACSSLFQTPAQVDIVFI